MPAYDRTFNPPAPVVATVFVNPLSGLRTDVIPGKLDTGADLTVVPQTVIAQLGIQSQASVWARSYDGSYSERPAYYIGMTLNGDVLRVVRCIAVNRNSVLLGRNVLNRFVITLDGPRLRFSFRRA